MPLRLPNLDRRLGLSAIVLLASAILLGLGLFSIFAALRDDNVDLPAEGSLQEILAQNQGYEDLAQDAAAAGPPQGPFPVHIAIPRIFVDAPVQTMGLDERNYPLVPDAAEIVAWYTFSSAPGHNSNAVFSGHVDWQTRRGQPIPGVFYHLRELQIGDPITIKLEDGSELTYRVTGNVAIQYEDPNVLKVMDDTSKDVLTLITCGGTWTKDFRAQYGGNYSHRIVVRAERVSGLASEAANR